MFVSLDELLFGFGCDVRIFDFKKMVKEKGLGVKGKA